MANTITLTLDAACNGAGYVLRSSQRSLPGTHTIVAVYSGNANFQISSSVPASLVIDAIDYTLTIQTEHHANKTSLRRRDPIQTG